MTNKIGPKEKLVLVSVLRDRESLSAQKVAPMVDTNAEASHRANVQNAQEGGFVRLNLALWLGHAPSPSEAVMYSRVYARLEALGLIERSNPYGNSRTTHVRLTKGGSRIAKKEGL
jgi:hypothetical protein